MLLLQVHSRTRGLSLLRPVHMAARRYRRREDEARAREESWDRGLNHACWHSRKSEYNALYDTNMRHFFENEHLQLHLYHAGLIDKSGRVLDLERNKSKINVIENEFKQAERAELWRQKEEQEMRDRVQKKRFEALERAKREERILRTREDSRIRKGIVAALRHQTAPPVSQPASRKKSSRAQSTTSSGGPGASAHSSIYTAPHFPQHDGHEAAAWEGSRGVGGEKQRGRGDEGFVPTVA